VIPSVVAVVVVVVVVVSGEPATRKISELEPFARSSSRKSSREKRTGEEGAGKIRG